MVDGYAEIGTTGLKQFNGRYEERYIPELRGPEGLARLGSLLRREPAAYVVNNAISLTARQATWKVTPASDKPEDKAVAEFIEQCVDDMSSTFQSVNDFALSAQAFGFADLHIVWKRRSGPQGQPESKYKDGLVGLRKLAIRRQETIDQWLIDENGGHKAMIQIDPNTGLKYAPVEIERLLHFVGGSDRGSWEGLGWLEPCWPRANMIQSLEIIYGIGQQRAFVGLPTFKYTTTAPSATDILKVETMLKRLVVNEQAYVTYPGAAGEFSFTTVPNPNAADLRAEIQQQRWEIMLLGLAQFLRLGNSESGSRALADPLITLFKSSVQAANSDIASVYNRFLIPRLLSINPSLAGKIEDLPRFEPSSVHNLGLAVLDFLGAIQGFIAGASPDDSNWLRTMIGMPQVDPNNPLMKMPDQPNDNPQDNPADNLQDNPRDNPQDNPQDNQQVEQQKRNAAPPKKKPSKVQASAWTAEEFNSMTVEQKHALREELSGRKKAYPGSPWSVEELHSMQRAAREFERAANILRDGRYAQS